MSKNRLLYSECLKIYKVSDSFIESLHESGLIHLERSEQDLFIEYDELTDLEQFVRWHCDMDINVPGIEALYHMLNRVRTLQLELEELRNELRFYR
ncbi:MAG: chaperone modulator CbpM [Dysgonamonadaceae bacterium]|jgi:hypothetical protein|nr:chaperone modulator CbpM [Dysgonamonadaceae bacterium]